MATHAEVHSTQGEQGIPGPAPTGTQNLVLATPDGSSGIASLRAIVNGDLPTLGGDVTGTLTAMTVVKFQTRDISSSAPSGNDILTWNSGTSKWTPTALSAVPNANASELQSINVSSTAPVVGEKLQYSLRNAQWEAKFSRWMRWQPCVSSTRVDPSGATFGGASTASQFGTGVTSAAVVSTATEHYGISLTTPATATRSAGMGMTGASSANTGPNNLGIANLKYIRWRMSINSVTSMRAFICLTNATGSSTNPPEGTLAADKPNVNIIGFRFSSAVDGGVWQMYTGTGSGASATVNPCTGVGSTADTSVHNFMIAYDGSTYHFYIDDVHMGSQNTNAPATSVMMGDVAVIDNIGLANAKGITMYGITAEILNG
jgi:hypothetical protein